MSTQSGLLPVRRALGLAGWIFVYAAVIAMAWEIFVSLKAARYTMISAAEHWYQLHAPSLAAFQEFLAVQIPAVASGPVSTLLLNWPAWVLYGGAGLVLLGIAQIGRGRPAEPVRVKRVMSRDLAWHGPIPR